MRGRSERRSLWGPIVAFAVVSSANQLLWLDFAPITTGAAARLGVSASTVGLLAEVVPLVYVVMAVPVGRALDRWFRPALAAGAVLVAAGGMLRLAGHGFAPVMAGQLLVAVGQPALLNSVTGVATRTMSEPDRPLGIAVGSAGTFLGFVLAFALGLGLGAAHLRAIMWVSAIYAVAGAVALLAQLWRPIVVAGDVTAPRGARAGAVRAVWADPVMRVVLALVFVGFGVFVAMTTWLQTLLSPAGIGTRAADALLVVMVVAGIASGVAIPEAVARRGAQARALTVAAGGGFVSCLLLAVRPGVAVDAVALGLFGLVLLPALPVLLELVEHRCGDLAVTATGLLWLSGNAGGIVVALAVQAVQSRPAAAFVIMALIAAGATPLAGRLHNALRPVPAAQRTP